MQCPNCEAENREGARFCDECGFPLVGTSMRSVSGRSAAAGSVAASDSGEPRGAEASRSSEVRVGLDGEEPGDDEPAPSGDGQPGGAETAGSELKAEAADSIAIPDLVEPLADLSGFATSQFVEGGDATVPLYGEDGGPWRPELTEEMPRVGESGPQPGNDFIAGPAQSGKGRKGMGVAIALIILVLTGVAIAASYAAGAWGGKVVPNVIGMTEPDAESALAGNGFTARSTQVRSDDTEGLVLLMDPDAGSRAPEGSEVVIHIATARIVPDVVGKDIGEAKSELEDVGYDNVAVETVKSDKSENVVVSIAPEAGTRAKSNAEITVTVTEAYRVPDVSGLEIEEAREVIGEAGLAPIVEYVDTEKYVEGTILGTTPDAGTRVTKEETVIINVARDRAAELEGLTEELLSPGNAVTVGGVDYDIESLDYVSYEGDDTVSFGFTGRPKITFLGETLYSSSAREVEGEVVWSDSDKVISIS